MEVIIQTIKNKLQEGIKTRQKLEAKRTRLITKLFSVQGLIEMKEAEARVLTGELKDLEHGVKCLTPEFTNPFEGDKKGFSNCGHWYGPEPCETTAPNDGQKEIICGVK